VFSHQFNQRPAAVGAAESECGLPRPCGICGRYRSRDTAATTSCAPLSWRMEPVRPFVLELFVESLCLAVGLRAVGPGSFGFQAHSAAGFSPLLVAVGTAVV